MNYRTFAPRYMWRRLKQLYFQKSNPELPWLAENTIMILSEWLKAGDSGFEYGSGRSTLWLANRIEHLVSVEHDEQWFEKVGKNISRSQLAEKVDYRHCTIDKYPDVIKDFPNESFDFILVDGKKRLECMANSVAKLKPGGLLILDNANRFLPNKSLNNFSAFYDYTEKPRPEWAAFTDSISNWRTFFASDGILDTRFWIKPSSMKCEMEIKKNVVAGYKQGNDLVL
ncbi:MAG: hypothetical protein A2Y10_12480 [Planctomycetes bacterium GWF2_41_51]|nr:MAG: hypothetical protein A2Y10_12480 [Planctomycetes bacterium GWF2_41_51]HBG27238.1 hypothetical protein [Phycisphaerales bacterium]